jgi:acyl-CoA hydrolase
MKAKKAIESLAVSTEIVLPNDTNTLGNLMGGRLLHWMDITSAIAAHRHCRRVVVALTNPLN